MIHTRLSVEADFIALGTSIGRPAMASMLHRHLDDKTDFKTMFGFPTRVEAPELYMGEPATRHNWFLLPNADINDEWGEGMQIRTGPYPWLQQFPVIMMVLLEFIREWGITDTSCRFRLIFSQGEKEDNDFRIINPLRLILGMNEDELIEIWGRHGGFKRRSHLEHMRAVLTTNLFWQDVRNWAMSPTKHLDFDRGYTLDLLELTETGRLAFDFVQGHHYEHRANDVGLLISHLGDAIRDALHPGDEQKVAYVQRAHDFFIANTKHRHPQARFRPPED